VHRGFCSLRLTRSCGLVGTFQSTLTGVSTAYVRYLSCGEIDKIVKVIFRLKPDRIRYANKTVAKIRIKTKDKIDALRRGSEPVETSVCRGAINRRSRPEELQETKIAGVKEESDKDKSSRKNSEPYEKTSEPTRRSRPEPKTKSKPTHFRDAKISRPTIIKESQSFYYKSTAVRSTVTKYWHGVRP
jgi:hypothetical protein